MYTMQFRDSTEEKQACGDSFKFYYHSVK